MILAILPWPPSANKYWRNVRGRMVVSREARAYKQHVALLVSREKPISGDVKLTICFYRPRKSGDCDNFLKVAIDSVKGFLFHDDSQIVEIHAKRFDDKSNPRVEMNVEAA